MQNTLRGLITATPNPEEGMSAVERSLAFVRNHLGMEVAYLSEFVDGDLVFRAVDAPGFEDVVAVNKTMPLDQVYCPHILEGRLPELIPDTLDIPFARDLPLTHSIPIRSHVSIPIHRRDGSVFGMFCCLSRKPNPSLNLRDMDVMRAFASVTGDLINTSLSRERYQSDMRARISAAMTQSSFTVVFQPIYSIQTARPMGFEALCRFHSDPYEPPNIWFGEARKVGLQEELEVEVIRRALTALDLLPDDMFLSVNVSPDTVASGKLSQVFQGYPRHRIVLEMTEHTAVSDYELLLDELAILRVSGLKLAIDDAGAGYSSLQHIVRLKPDIIKLDISLTSNIDRDLIRRSLAQALTGFAAEIDCKMVAEGIETSQELDVLRDMAVDYGQGYYLCRPQPLAEILELMEADRVMARTI